MESKTATQTKSKLQPLGNRILIKHLEAEEKLKGGIILPDSAKKKQATAVVISVGAGIPSKDGTLQPMPVKVGEKVLIDKYAGQEVTLDGEVFVIVKAEDIIAVVN